jgi:hypothetical protein
MTEKHYAYYCPYTDEIHVVDSYDHTRNKEKGGFLLATLVLDGVIGEIVTKPRLESWVYLGVL